MRITLLSLCFFLTLSLQSQSSSYQKELDVLVTEMQTEFSSSGEAIKQAEAFEQLTYSETPNWLAFYYTSYSYVMAAFLEPDPKVIDKLAQKAQSTLDGMDISDQDESEIYCLKSLITSALILADPNTRGMKYGMESSALLNKAKSANPDNPRVYLIEGQGLLYMPVAYGGGCNSAIPLLQIALEKYNTYAPKGDLYPNWGKDEVVQLLANCKSN